MCVRSSCFLGVYDVCLWFAVGIFVFIFVCFFVNGKKSEAVCVRTLQGPLTWEYSYEWMSKASRYLRAGGYILVGFFFVSSRAPLVKQWQGVLLFCFKSNTSQSSGSMVIRLRSCMNMWVSPPADTVGGVSIGILVIGVLERPSLSRKGCVFNRQTTKAGNKWVHAPRLLLFLDGRRTCILST